MERLDKKKLKKTVDAAAKITPLNAPAKDTKRAVTLYLNKKNFDELQRRYGRKASSVIDEMIDALLKK